MLQTNSQRTGSGRPIRVPVPPPKVYRSVTEVSVCVCSACLRALAVLRCVLHFCDFLDVIFNFFRLWITHSTCACGFSFCSCFCCLSCSIYFGFLIKCATLRVCRTMNERLLNCVHEVMLCAVLCQPISIATNRQNFRKQIQIFFRLLELAFNPKHENAYWTSTFTLWAQVLSSIRTILAHPTLSTISITSVRTWPNTFYSGFEMAKNARHAPSRNSTSHFDSINILSFYLNWHRCCSP